MAADFPANLDDGELWLPSEIIPDVVDCLRHNRRSSAAVRPPDIAYIEDLAQQLAALGFFDRSLRVPPLKPSPNFSHHHERYYMASGPVGPVSPLPPGGLVYERFGPATAAVGTGAYFPSPRPVQRRLSPGRAAVRAQPDGYRPVRGRVQPNRFVMPVRLAGSGRECSGTGVFLPRVALDVDDRKKQPNKLDGTKGGKQQRQEPIERRRTMGVPVQSPTTEMGLPQDWTY